MICYLFLNVLKIQISENLRFLRTNVVSVVALPGFCDAIGANPCIGVSHRFRRGSSKGHSHPAKKYIGPVFMFGHLGGNRIPDVLIAWNEPDRRSDGKIVEDFYSFFVAD